MDALAPTTGTGHQLVWKTFGRRSLKHISLSLACPSLPFPQAN
jgi:hypothetical protein